MSSANNTKGIGIAQQLSYIMFIPSKCGYKTEVRMMTKAKIKSAKAA
jgi:hypothetical protein